MQYLEMEKNEDITTVRSRILYIQEVLTHLYTVFQEVLYNFHLTSLYENGQDFLDKQ